MSHKLARLLGETEDTFQEQLGKLEAVCGYPSKDVQLLSDSVPVVRVKIAELGLDPDDTTADELHNALINRYRHDSRQLGTDFDLEEAGLSVKRRRAIELAWHCLADDHLWVLKPTAVRAMLKKLPPVQTRKILGFRSLDSMLKRYDINLVVAVALRAESDTWQQSWQRMLKRLPQSAFEMRRISVTQAPENLGLGDSEATVSIAELGALIIWQPIGVGPTDMLGQVLQIITSARKLTGHDSVAELAKLHPVLHWWSGNSHLVAWFGSEPVSLNICDVAINSDSESGFGERSLINAGQTLWRKLTDGYRELAEGLSAGKMLDEAVADQKLTPALANEEFDNG